MGVIDYMIRRRVKAIEDRYQVFEVTNLTIPAGADWELDGGSSPHPIGELTLPIGSAFMVSAYIELAESLGPGGDWVAITAYNDLEEMQLPDPGQTQVGQLSAVARIGDQNNPVKRLKFLSGWSFLPPTSSGVFQTNGELPDTTFTVAISASLPTAGDVTIVRARAAFQVT